MANIKMDSLRLTLLVTLLALIAGSCVPTSQLSYFNDIDEMSGQIVNPRTQKIIRPFDKLYVRVLSIDLQTSQIFNASDEMRMGGYGTLAGLIGYLVDEDGNINFPFVGKIQVASLTTAEAAEKIQTALSDYVSNTSIVVKYVDNQVTVMGEVMRQGVYSFSQDKLNIYEALGLGGGLTRYGDRKKVILVRNEDGKVMHHRLNLSDSKIANKSYYYVLPNDVIVVEPLNAISSSYSNITYTTLLSTISTAIAVLLFAGLRF
ncbi:MAG: polysaccharide biosynthesis/export family protein [Bacteroidales bacterium]|nr:polysaccharide biosynthesis/export family protein [Bacteroidales bacterium]MDT8375067.1 polysaccharide biosynthesis/export family protein [Bacteroidales bacterium]